LELNKNMTLSWQFKSFLELNTIELYQIMALRQKVFIVEQKDIYLDADGKDLAACHLMGTDDDKLIAYARIIFPENNQTLSFGRVIVDKDYRGTGLARILIQQILDYLQNSEYANCPIKISAQAYLINLYQYFGFKTTGEIYLDGTISHIDMMLDR
jgi:ElaA protein